MTYAQKLLQPVRRELGQLAVVIVHAESAALRNWRYGVFSRGSLPRL